MQDPRASRPPSALKDAVICATGYRRGLDRLVGHLDVLAEPAVAHELRKTGATRGPQLRLTR